MSNLSLNQLSAIAEASQLLGEAETSLRQQQKFGVADMLRKLQQDAGASIARKKDSACGASARLKFNFGLVTESRTNAVLEQAADLLPEAKAIHLHLLLGKLGFKDLPAAEVTYSHGQKIIAPAPR